MIGVPDFGHVLLIAFLAGLLSGELLPDGEGYFVGGEFGEGVFGRGFVEGEAELLVEEHAGENFGVEVAVFAPEDVVDDGAEFFDPGVEADSFAFVGVGVDVLVDDG